VTPEQRRQWCAGSIAQQRAIRDLHCDDGDGRCGFCVRVGLLYHQSPARFPCGPWQAAREMIRFLGGDPDR